MRRLRDLRLLLATIAAALLFMGLNPVSASSANISHSYHSTSVIANGSIVSLDPQHSDYVQLSNSTNGARLLGVTLASNDSLIAVDPSTSEIQVAISGTVNTLVSNVNGDINVGDQIAVSPFNGIGMKAAPSSNVIGLAQTAFNSRSAGATTQQITGKNGKTSQVSIGYVKLSMAIGIATSTQANLNNLQKFTQSLTGHTISTVRIAVSLAVAFIAIVVLIVLIYASIYGSIISIGRNPLAKYTVFRTLGAVLGMAFLTAATAGLIIFLLLR